MANCQPTTAKVRHRPKTGYLATPLSSDERRFVGEMYRKHQGLLRLIGRKMLRKYPFVNRDDIFSCIDSAFIKTCRAWDPLRGTFSTLLSVFAEGDILHFIRDNNWLIKAPGSVRQHGQRARRLLESGVSLSDVLAQLQITEDALRHALVATQPAEHDIRSFDLHICPRATPWELLEAEVPAEQP